MEKEIVKASFFRYEAVQYASIDYGDGGYIKDLPFQYIKLELKEYNLWKETPKGYWIGYGMPDKLNDGGRWVSKTAKKRFAYPTKKEAIVNFIKRTEKRVNILSNQIISCKSSLAIAKYIDSKIEIT